MDLPAFEEALASFVSEDPRRCADREAIASLETSLRRLEAFVTRAVACFDADRTYELDGARSAASWITARCHLPRGEAKRQLRLGRALRELPVCEGAFSRGDIGSAQVDAFVPLLRQATHDALLEREELLVDKARELPFSQLHKALAYFAQLADPDGAEEGAEATREGREVYLAESYEGAFFGKITLDPIAGAIVAGELSRLEQVGFETDWKAAKERLGREPRREDLARSGGQRRADALVEMARRSAACPDDARFPAPLVSVLVGYETIHGRICELANGTVVSPGSLLSYLDEALVERAVFTGATRVEVGAKTRLFSGATRRAIELRDRVCQHPFCEVKAERCEVDHIVPASQGGPTTQENGRLLCGWHNRLRNHLPDLVPSGAPGRPPPGG